LKYATADERVSGYDKFGAARPLIL